MGERGAEFSSAQKPGKNKRKLDVIGRKEDGREEKKRREERRKGIRDREKERRKKGRERANIGKNTYLFALIT